MPKRKKTGRYGALSAMIVVVVVLTSVVLVSVSYFGRAPRQAVLRISDWKTGEIYVEHSVLPGDELRFGWIHSIENIPWNEYYYIDENLNLILNTITVTSFGAGIPHDKGIVSINNGVIYMSQINQKFTELVWINSPAAQEIMAGGEFITRGSELPHDRRLILTVVRRNIFGS